jgi:chitosanase
MNLLTDTQKRVAQAIVNIFETSSVRGDYSRVTLIEGDTGQLTYGRSQTTLTSGNLFKLIHQYCQRPGARFGEALSEFLSDLEAQDPGLNHHSHFHNLLRASADDLVMRDTQDEFFDSEYWATADRIARRDGICTPLGVAVVYDSVVHGSWPMIRRRVNESLGMVEDTDERTWITEYVKARHDWLANHRRLDLRPTVYRMASLGRLIEQEAWMLELPLVVRRLEINQQALFATPPYVYDGPEPRSREIVVTSPLQRGLDVRLVQVALSEAGHDVRADGIYGRVSKGIVESFQHENGLAVTGAIGVSDFEALGL